MPYGSVFQTSFTDSGLKKTVTVHATDRLEAEQIVSDNWRNSDYILDADNFVGVEFEASAISRERAGKGKERNAL